MDEDTSNYLSVEYQDKKLADNIRGALAVLQDTVKAALAARLQVVFWSEYTVTIGANTQLPGGDVLSLARVNITRISQL